jgi:two-component system, cell cycle sensor histidine kinase and response regulator CckA
MKDLADDRFVGLLEAAPDAMVCVDRTGVITLVNAQTERLFGYHRDDIVGKPVEILVPEATRAVHPGHRATYAACPQPRPMGAGMELAGRRRDGSTFPAEISLSAIGTGEAMLVMAAVRDVTARRAAEATAARLASIIQSSHDAVVGETLDRVITSWNPGAERLYGYRAGEMIGRHIDVLISPGTQKSEEQIHAAITRGERVEQFVSERVRKDGTTLQVSTTLSPITDRDGAIVGVSTVSRDLTAEQRADTRLRALLEAAPDAMVCVSRDGRIAVVNAQAERLFGYRRGELVGQPVEILVPDSMRSLHPARRAGYVADPKPRPMGAGTELAGRRRDGSTFPAEISLSAIDTDEGILVTAAVRDVTERQRAHENAARLASIIQSSHDAVISKTLDQVITSWNPAAQRLYGYTAEEMIGQPVWALFPEPECEHEMKMLAAVVRGERVEEHQATRVRKDGSLVTVSVTLSPIIDRAGKIIGISNIARDLSEKQRAEVRFVGLLEAAPDAMVCVDGNGQIALVNAQAERLFGYHRGELVGQPVEILVPDSMRSLHPARRAGYVADPRPRPMGAGTELAGRRRDGSTFPAEISLSAIDTDQGILVTAAVRDVTERTEIQAERERLKTQAERDRLERQLQQSQRLESLGQLAGGVAHDFNNLLGVITNYVAFIAEEVRHPGHEGSSESVLSDLEQVQLAAERASALTHQLLAFARREVVQPRVLSLNEVVTGVMKLLRRTLGEHVQVITELSADLDVVLADPGQIEQILVNLAVNSRDAMTGGGTLTIETSNVNVDGTYAASRANLAPGRYAALKVSDNGPGMPQEVADRAFEPFFTTKPKGEGTGLGLATIYGTVTQAGGNVRIYSEPGLGTTITVMLPVTEHVRRADERQPAEVQGGSGEVLLLVEDEAALREVARRILSRNGYEVIVASNGQEAIEAALRYEGHIDGLVTDVVMPGMQGKELADRIRQIQPDIGILFMSGYTQGILGAQGVLESGINLIEKPFSEATLLQKVRKALRAAGTMEGAASPGSGC